MGGGIEEWVSGIGGIGKDRMEGRQGGGTGGRALKGGVTGTQVCGEGKGGGGGSGRLNTNWLHQCTDLT